jgi:hypothetical protein
MSEILNHDSGFASSGAPVCITGDHPGPMPITPEKEIEVRKQLNRILAHPLFKKSARCSSLLRHLIDNSLQGEPAQVKERTLGIEVFGRRIDYDTKQDTVVRHVASDVRKRLNQYYSEAEHEGELRFEIPPGSYIATFCFPAKLNDANDTIDPSVASSSESSALGHAIHRAGWAALISVLILSAGGIIVLWQHNMAGRARTNSRSGGAAISLTNPAFGLFWKPLLDPSSSVMLCAGSEHPQSLQPDKTLSRDSLPNPSNNYVTLLDVSAIAELSGFLAQAGKQFQVKGAHFFTFDDLRQHPAILIGGLDNPWTLRITEGMRFHIVRAQTSAFTDRIEDSLNKGSTPRSFHDAPGPDGLEEYAIVARLSEQGGLRDNVLVVAGLGDHGTSAALEALLDQSFIASLTNSLPKDWPSKNMEAVFEIRVIDGNSTVPRVLAVELW